MEALLDAPMEIFSAVQSNNTLITTVLLAIIIPFFSRRVYQFFTRDYPNMIHYILMHYILRREVGLVQADVRQLVGATPMMNDELIEIILLYVNHLLRASSVAQTNQASTSTTPSRSSQEAGHMDEDGRTSPPDDASSSSSTSSSSVLFPFAVSAESLRYAGYRYVQRPRMQAEKHSATSSLGRSAGRGGGGRQLAELLEKEYEVSMSPANDVALEVEPGLFIKVVPVPRAWRTVRHERRQQRRLMSRLRQSHFLRAAGQTGASGPGGENVLLGGPLITPRGIEAEHVDRVMQSRLKVQVTAIEKAAKQRSAVMLASDALDQDARELFLFSDMLRDMRVRMRDPLENPNRRSEDAETHSRDAAREGETVAHPPGFFARLVAAAQNGPYSTDYDGGDSEDTDEESEEIDSDSDNGEGLDAHDRLLTVQDWMPRQLVFQSRVFRSRAEEQQFLQMHRQWQRERVRRRVQARARERGWDAAQLREALVALDACLDRATTIATTTTISDAELSEISVQTGLSVMELRDAHLLAPQSRVDQFLFRAVSWYQDELQRSTSREAHFLMYPYAGELEAALQVRMQQGNAGGDGDDDDDYDDYDDDGGEPNALAAPANGGRLLAVRRYALPEHGGKTFDALFFPQKARVMHLLDDFRHRTGKFGIPGLTNKLTILLHGPPGTGKTSLVKAMARYLVRHVLVIPLTTLHTNGALQDWMSEREASCIGESSTVCDVDQEDVEDMESWDMEYCTSTVAKKVVLRPHELIYLLEDVDAVDWSDMQDTETDVEKRAALRLQQLGFTPLHKDDEGLDDAGLGPGKDKKKGPSSGDSANGPDGETDSTAEGAAGRTRKTRSGGGGGGSDSEADGDSDDAGDGDDDDEEEEEDPAVVAEKKRKRMEKLFQAVFVQLERDRLSVDGILRVLNGVAVPASRITVLTTNHPEKLDARLLQPGVIDLKINMEDLEKEDVLEMIAYYFDDHMTHRTAAPVVDTADRTETSTASSSLTATKAHENLRRLLEEYERSKAPSQTSKSTTDATTTASTVPLKINPARLEQLCVECDSVEQLVALLDTTETRYGNIF